ncbi:MULTISPECIES: OmpA family protein [unclassified Luteococcus]|uniref:OmpA family protein n=1 Tax=unclassified Luteococcus TaxID=2639923 RepID=UPI00313AA3AD
MLLSALCWLGGGASVSVANTDEPPPADDSPTAGRTFFPEPLPRPDAYPSSRIVAVSSDLAGTVERREQTGRLDLRLDANVLFGRDSDVLRPQAIARLEQIAGELRTSRPSAVTITGHTDDLGSAEHGLDLSRRRAQRVSEALKPGLGKHRVTVLGRGEEQPLVPNESEQGRARNRRVEIQVRPR